MMKQPEVELAKKHNFDVNWRDGMGYTLLHTAAHYRNAELVEKLLARGANINARNMFGETPFYGVCGNPYDFPIAKLLVKRGADIDIPDKYGNAPLEIAKKM